MSDHSRITVRPDPLMSIIIATFNVVETLGAAIDSVIAERRENVEIIVIDGGSKDGTLDVILTRASEIAYWVSEPDGGIYHAWNKGVKAARGQYIGFLGADDVLLPGALGAYERAITAHPEAEYLSSRVHYDSGARGRIIGQAWNWRAFRRRMTVAHVASMHRRSLFERIGIYDETFAITGDYELLLRAGAALRTAYIEDITVRMSADGISSAGSLKVFSEAARAKRLHSALPGWIITYDRYRAIMGARLRHFLRR